MRSKLSRFNSLMEPEILLEDDDIETLARPHPGFASQDAGELVLHARVPKFRPDELSVEVENGILTLRAEKDENGPHRHVQRSFVRSIELPKNVDENAIEAVLDNGLLTVRVPARQPMPARRIKIIVAGDFSHAPRAHEVPQTPQVYALTEYSQVSRFSQLQVSQSAQLSPYAQISRASLPLYERAEAALARITWSDLRGGAMAFLTAIDALINRIVMSRPTKRG